MNENKIEINKLRQGFYIFNTFVVFAVNNDCLIAEKDSDWEFDKKDLKEGGRGGLLYFTKVIFFFDMKGF